MDLRERLKRINSNLGTFRDNLVITRDGEAIYTKYNEENEEWSIGTVSPSYILFHLHDGIILEPGFTLRDYFKFIENYPNFILIDYFFDCFLEEYRNCPESGCKDPDREVDYLCLNRIMAYEAPAEIDTSKIDGLGDLYSSEEQEEGIIRTDESIEYFIDFHGISADEKNSYALEFSPLYQLLDHEIILGNVKVSIELPGKIEDYEKFEDKYITRETEDNNYTLYEFVKEIIWELSFCGCPENRDIKWKEIKDATEEARKEIENDFESRNE